jgi:hypothetical protein
MTSNESMCLTLAQVKFRTFIPMTSDGVKDAENSKFDIVWLAEWM